MSTTRAGRSKNIYSFIGLSLLVTTMVACNKEPLPPEPIPGTATLKINLAQSQVKPAQIDSAFLVWNTPAGYDSAKFEVRENSLEMSTSPLPRGEKQYTIALMTSAKLGYNPLKWDRLLKTSFDPKKDLTIDGPLSLDDTTWMPRVILDDHTGLIAFSGIRPGDPHFSFFRVDPSWQRIEFDRSYWNTKGGVQWISGGVWRGNNVLDQNGMYSNETFFTYLPAQTGTRIWNHIEIFIMFSTKGNEQMRGLSFTHNF